MSIMYTCVSQVLPELHSQAGVEVVFLPLQYLVLKIFKYLKMVYIFDKL